jgi:Glucose / Sorbosone dehydrogenase/RTX calcium-binding nonapeptide repeat (4 copies)
MSRGEGFARRFSLASLLAVAALIAAPAPAGALSLEQVGSFDRPTYVTSDPADPNRLFVVEQAGRIQLVEGVSTTTFLDIEPLVHDLTSRGDYGLFSLAFSPDYATNHLFYVTYSGVDDPGTVEDESGDWHLDEFSANGDTADPASRRELLTVGYRSTPQIHYGGQLQFGPDGYLYASTGDGGPQGDPNGNAQNLQTLLGKILRIDPEGSAPGEYTVPANNPFATLAGCADGCDEIWSYGLRHPWRFSFDRLTGDLVIGDVGHQSWEEVDLATAPDPGKGDNFGWNCREGAHPGPGESSSVCADRMGTFAQAIFEYPHVLDVNANCSNPAAPRLAGSITGGYVVRDPALGGLYGRYLYADFCIGEIRSVALGLPTASCDQSEALSVPLPTSFGEDADGRIYVASFNGPVYRVTEPADTPSGPADTPSGPADTPSGPADTASGPAAATICKGKPGTIVGAAGKDVLKGTPRKDVMVGLGGNDTLSGLAGNDIICSGSGNDTLKGGAGKDQLHGQKGKDVCKGGKGRDTADNSCEVASADLR